MKRSHWAAVLWLSLVAIVVLMGTVCCDRDAARSRIIITRVADPESSDTLAATPFLSDVVDPGADGILGTDDDVVYEDRVIVTVENHPPSDLATLSPGTAFSSVTLNRYRVVFNVPDEEIPSVEGSMHMVVNTGQSATGSVVLVTGLAKTQPPLSSLGGSANELLGSAVITLYGHEETSEEPVSAEATIQVHFADWLD